MADEATTTTDEQAKLLATGALFQALAKDPKHRKDVLSLIKRASPDTPIPELDLEAAITQRVQDQFKPKDDEVKALKDQVDTLNRRLARDDWAKQHGLQEEEVVEVEALAKEKHISDGKTAVEFYQMQRQLGTPRGTRKPPKGTEEYLSRLGKINPRNSSQLKRAATDEAVRIISGRRAG